MRRSAWGPGALYLRRRLLETTEQLVRDKHKVLCHELEYINGLIRVYQNRQKHRFQKRLSLLRTRYDKTLKAARKRHRYRTLAVERWRAVKLGKALASFDKQRALAEAAVAKGDGSEPAQAPGTHPRQDLTTIDRDHRQRLQEISVNQMVEWGRLAEMWRTGLSEVAATVESIRETVDRQNPPWEHPSWEAWTPPIAVPSVVRFGNVSVDLDHVPNGRPRDDRLMEGLRDTVIWPALLEFPKPANLLIEAPDDGQMAAVELLKAASLRMLTSIPPALLKITIIDPVGFGHDFGSLLHLSDFPEMLAPVKTEPGQIEQTLNDLCDHIGKIVLYYLRDEHKTICEFNTSAGEVAEPFRILIISNFPAGFTEVACARLRRSPRKAKAIVAGW